MKKLIQVLIVCGLFVVMGGTASGKILKEAQESKVVFSILPGNNTFSEEEELDEFKEFSHNVNFVGCDYEITVKNNKNYKIKVGKFNFGSNNQNLFPNSQDRMLLNGMNKIIEPGEKYTSRIRGPQRRIETKEQATAEQIEKWQLKYGCEEQRGSIFIQPSHAAMIPFVTFPKDSGISEQEAFKHIIGSSAGVNPLKLKWIKRQGRPISGGGEEYDRLQKLFRKHMK